MQDRIYANKTQRTPCADHASSTPASERPLSTLLVLLQRPRHLPHVTIWRSKVRHAMPRPRDHRFLLAQSANASPRRRVPNLVHHRPHQDAWGALPQPVAATVLTHGPFSDWCSFFWNCECRLDGEQLQDSRSSRDSVDHAGFSRPPRIFASFVQTASKLLHLRKDRRARTHKC